MTTAIEAPGLSIRQSNIRQLADGGSPLLVAAALLLLALTLPMTAAAWLDIRQFNGINIWIKPLKFQVSLALHIATIAWLMHALPGNIRASRSVRVLLIALVAAAFFEALYIAFQASRGTASHFNFKTPIESLMYQLMGFGAVTLVVVAAWIGVLILRHGDRQKLVVLGAGLGLVLGGILGGLTGGYMSGQPGHWVGTPPTDAAGLWLFGWSRSGGDLRVAHFFGLHMMQALPILAWFATKTVSRAGRAILITGAVLGTLLTAATFWQAVLGRPFL